MVSTKDDSKRRYCEEKNQIDMKYPIGIQNFESLRNDGYVYVDKTALIYRLVNEGRYYFLSRPRRFGKSLLISTLDAYLSGKKELFKGLAMEKLEKDWTEYLIFHLDLNVGEYQTKSRSMRSLMPFSGLWKSSTAPCPRFTRLVSVSSM